MTRLLAVLLATSAVLSAPAFAQDTTDEQIVITAQRKNETQVQHRGQVGVLGDKPAADVPFTVRSYSGTLIYNQQPQTLGQVLDNDPTIRTSYAFGNAAEQFVVRGFTLFGDDVALDGLYGITPRQLIAPELYDSVQVLGGASAFLNGAAPGGSGIGGSINLVLKHAGDRDLSRATFGYLSDGNLGASIDVSRRFGDGAWGVRLTAAHRAGNDSIDGEDRRTSVVGGSVDYAGSAVRLSLSVAYQNIRVDRLRPKVTVTTFVPRVPRASANYAQRWTYTNLKDLFGEARAELDVAKNVLLYAQAGARDGSERGVYGGITALDPSGAALGSALFVPRTDDNGAGQAGVRAKLVLGGLANEINGGFSLVRELNRNAFDFLGGFGGYATNLYDTPDVPLPPSGFVGGDLDHPFPISRTDLTSEFASDTIGAWSDRVLLTAGVRNQRIEARGYSYSDGSLTSRYAKSAVTPVIGIVFKPAPGLSLYANRIEGLQQGPVAPVDPTISNPGELFPPFKSVQYETGAKLALGRLNAGIAAFRITQPSAFAIPDTDDPGLFRFGLFGEQRNQGVEVTLDGELARGLRLIGGTSLINAELRRTADGLNDGNRAPGVPKWLANASLEWDVPSLRGLTLTGRIIATGAQPVDAANTLYIPAWGRADLGARYVALIAARPVTFRAGVDNVADKRYWSSALETFGTSLLQGTPRTFRASVSVDF